MMPDIFDQIREEELTPDLQLISANCGMDAVRSLLRECSGLQFYIPKISSLYDFIENYMKRNRDKTLKQIARELRVSEQFLKNFRKRQAS